MKLILSRKGFDSSAGRQPSPILPDGTLLSLPINAEEDADTFGSLTWGGMSYYDIIHSLNPQTGFTPDTPCHLDPDIRKDVKARPAGWKPAFGQMDAALSALRNENVTLSDLFLFFGWFKQTEMRGGMLRYVRNAPDLHIIYGYMQIGAVIEKPENIPAWLSEHPHVAFKEAWAKGRNAIYLPTETLSLNENLIGCDMLDFRQDRVLTKDGMSRGCWDLPLFFKEVQIKYHPAPWKNGYFKSAGRGQEFVMEATPQIIDWAKRIIE